MSAKFSSENRLTFDFPHKNSENRVSELIVYIADKCLDDPTFGKVKLNKILYFADFIAFSEYNEPITGVPYMRLDNGPVPQQMVPVLRALEDRNRIAIRTRKVYSFERQRVVALTDANLDIFKAREIAIIDELIRVFWGRTAKQISDVSHGTAWKVARDREAIPYEASLLSDEGITEDDINRAQGLIDQHGWDV
jgi:hypothetical protein